MISLLAAAPLAAQITVGALPSNLNSSDAAAAVPHTDISLENPASGSGTIDTVTFGWNATCNSVAKIKFFRRNGNSLTQVDERGPFSTFAGGRVTQVVSITPPVNVQTGDLIGITQVGNCGNALAEAGTGTQGYVQLAGDVTSGTISGGNTFHDKLGVQGTGSAPSNVVAGYIPVVGSTAGSSGSFFKTSVQVFNPSSTSTITGRFIFHHAGTSGTLTDPSLTFSVGPNEILTVPDVIAAMPQSGIGSMDIAMAAGAQLPIIVTRVYNDAGAALGTSGVFEDVITPNVGVGTHILTTGNIGYILTPVEPNRTRINIGVRSLSSGMTLNAVLLDASGHIVQNTTKTYAPDWFEQVDAGTFFGVPVGGSQQIKITVTAGNGIIYGSTTDNVTNDPAIQFATAFPGS